jgi:lipopolysaccharide/colanic/teichoic acid biosynthesis glycosyltransferase
MSRGRSYCRGPVKRVLDVVLALLASFVLSPVLIILSLAVLLASGLPVLFLQERVGRDGRPFRLIKFRTMHVASTAGLPLTAKGDPRITRIGRFLRATKLDELPQLWNVLRGEMSLVGPRPEVPRYVAGYSAEHRRVLEARPGLTDPATVLFRNEEALIGSVPEKRREEFYLETVLPKKLRMNLEYIERASLTYDLALVLKTIQVVLWPGCP